MINLMVDIETTGLDPNENAIIQLAAVPFDLNILARGTQAFKMAMTIPSDRKWNENTKQWWEETNPNVLGEISKDAIHFIEVLNKFKEYVDKFEDEEIRFWSNHPFDWNFLNSYFSSYGVKRPFKYYAFRDLDTYIVALVGESNIKTYKPEADVRFEHDALYDCILQVDWLFESIRNKG